MKTVIRTLSGIAFAATVIGSASAASVKQEQLDVSWLKDGKQIAGGTSVVADPVLGEHPFTYTSGTEVGYGTCSTDGTTTRVRSETRFVGQSLVIEPVIVDGDKVRLVVAAEDTELAGTIRTTGSADCPSEVVDVHGLSKNHILVDMAVGESVNVPLGDPRYRLVLKLHRPGM